MTDKKHPLDEAAEQLERIANSPATDQEASNDFWELAFAMDETAGDYPQALVPEEYAMKHWSETDGIGDDGFPSVPDGLPPLNLQSTAHWTDVLSSSLWSGGYLLNQRALGIFKQRHLGDHRDYAAIVRDSGDSERSFTFVFCKNGVDPESLDFERSEFYVTDILGMPKGPIDVGSFEEFLDLQAKASAGELDGVEEFSSLDYKELHFKAGCTPSVDIFDLSRLGIRVYISNRLRTAILESGISGLEIKPNQRLFTAGE